MKRDNKIKVCRILAVVFLCFWTISGVRVLAQNATSILDKAASAYEDSNGLTAYFTMQTRSDVQKVSESFDGTIDIKGDKFVLKTPDMITWFDGTTQWSFVERNEEVNVSTPTGEELQATNPALLFRSYEKGSYIHYAGDVVHTVSMVLSGKVIIGNDDLWGNRNLLGQIGPGNCLRKLTPVRK